MRIDSKNLPKNLVYQFRKNEKNDLKVSSRSDMQAPALDFNPRTALKNKPHISVNHM